MQIYKNNTYLQKCDNGLMLNNCIQYIYNSGEIN